MKLTSSLLALAVLALITVSVESAAQQPKPGPEQARLTYFVGNWNTEADLKASSFGPGGKFTSQDHNKWMPGGFFLVISSDWKGGMGPGMTGTSWAVMGYDPEEKLYTYDEFNSVGEAVHSKGSVEGDTWTWNNDLKAGGKSYKGRFTMKILSPASYTMKYEVGDESGMWRTVMEGKATKTS